MDLSVFRDYKTSLLPTHKIEQQKTNGSRKDKGTDSGVQERTAKDGHRKTVP